MKFLNISLVMQLISLTHINDYTCYFFFTLYIELIEEETRRKLRSSQISSNGSTASSSSSANDSESSNASTSSDDGIRLVRSSSVKKTLFKNGSSPAKAIRTSPRKVEAQETAAKVVQTSLNNNKGPKKK